MSDIIKIKVPDIGDFDAVEVIEVLIQAGDTVKQEQALITLESDKASMEIPSTHAGTVKEVFVKVGDNIAQGANILSLSVSANAEIKQEAPAETEKTTNTPRRHITVVLSHLLVESLLLLDLILVQTLKRAKVREQAAVAFLKVVFHVVTLPRHHGQRLQRVDHEVLRLLLHGLGLVPVALLLEALPLGRQPSRRVLKHRALFLVADVELLELAPHTAQSLDLWRQAVLAHAQRRVYVCHDL